MTTVQDTLGSQVLLDLSRAATDLARARQHQTVRNCAGDRAAVAECHARIDSLLDLLLEASAGRSATRQPPADQGCPRAGLRAGARPSP
jgi:hypothetical protein